MVKTLIGASFLDLFSEYIWYNRLPFIISTILTTIIFIVHSIRLCHDFHQYRASKIQARITERSTSSNSPRSRSQTPTTDLFENHINSIVTLKHITTVLIMIFTLIHHIQGLLGLFPFLYEWLGPMIHCGIWPNLQAIWYHSGNCLIYNIFLIRIKITFAESVYEYKNSTLYTLFVFINLYWMYAIFGDFTEIYGSWIYIATEGSFWCQMHLAMFGVIVTGVIDTIISVICMVLFLKPLLKVLKHSNATGSCVYREVIIRYFILSFTAIASTSLWALLALFTDVGGLSAIDMTVNLICIMLMSNMYKKYYLFLCNPCHSLVETFQLKSMTQDKDVCRV